MQKMWQFCYTLWTALKPPQAIIDEIRDKHGDSIAEHLDQSLSKLVEQLISFGLIIPEDLR